MRDARALSSQQIEWIDPAQLRAERDAFLDHIEAWRRDWESGDTARYLSHYGREFRTGDRNLNGWRAHKHRVNARKTWIRVALRDISAFRDPGEKELLTVTFEQDYRSSDLSGRSRKRQYWAQEDGTWKIVYEAAVRTPILTLPESYPGRKHLTRRIHADTN